MKAILVIDVDEEDIGREVNYINVKGGGMSYIVGTMGEDVRLRPLPKKEEKPIKGEDDYNDFCIGYTSGWNDCLEAMGETE